jgi:hypothetical protein
MSTKAKICFLGVLAARDARNAQNSVDVGFVSNRIRFHVAEHLLF